MRVHIWEHKKTKKLAKVVPWILASEEVDWHVCMDESKIKIGLTSIAQVGWMICNSQDVYFGMNMSVQKEFDDLGVVTDDLLEKFKGQEKKDG